MDQHSIQEAEDRRREGGHRPAGRDERTDAGAGWPRYRLAAAAHSMARRCDGHKGAALRAFTAGLTTNDRLSFTAHYYAATAIRAPHLLD